MKIEKLFHKAGIKNMAQTGQYRDQNDAVNIR